MSKYSRYPKYLDGLAIHSSGIGIGIGIDNGNGNDITLQIYYVSPACVLT